MCDLGPSHYRRERRVLMEMRRQQKSMSREVTMSRKKECSREAQNIVEKLIEPDVDVTWMLASLNHINQEHFDDVIEERFITKHCGYPLCDNILNDIPTKRYRISTATNRVYDITDRKKYCSNLCCKASQFIKDQLYTTPLWLRDFDEPIVFELYPSLNKRASFGKEFDVKFTQRLNPDIKIDVPRECDPLQNKLDNDLKKFPDTTPDVRGSSSPYTDECREKEYSYIDVNIRNLQIDDNWVKEEGAKMRPLKKAGDQMSMQEVISKVETNFKSWFTLDALCYLMGTHKVKDLMRQHGISPNKCEEMCDPDPFFYERYAAICKKLTNLEIQEEDKLMKLAQNPLSYPDELLDNDDFKDTGEIITIEPECQNDRTSPIIAQHARAMRRRIVLDTLEKTIPDIKNALGLSAYNFGTSVRHLVSLMNLNASNIFHKPTEWSFIAIVIIKLLTLRDENLHAAIASEPVSTHLQLILMSFDVDVAYLERLVCWFTDVEHLVNTKASVKIASK